MRIGDFRNSRWKDVVEACDDKQYSSLWHAFSSAAKRASAEGKEAEAEVFSLLADACSMVLSPSSPHEPFRPIAVFGNRRTAIPEDFSDADIQFFAAIAEFVDDPLIRARLADLVWLLGKPRDHNFALMAIDSYRQLPLDAATWFRDGETCWDRAARLALLLGAGAGKRLEEIQESLLCALEQSSVNDGFFPLCVAEVLSEAGITRAQEERIAAKLAELAAQFEEQGRLYEAQGYFAGSAHWYRRIRDEHRSAELTLKLAQALEKEALEEQTADEPLYGAAARLLEQAIHACRRIPGKLRPALEVDSYIEELQRQKQEAAARLVEEPGIAVSTPFDVSDLARASREAIGGKELPDALEVLATFGTAGGSDNLRQQAEELIRKFPLTHIFAESVVSEDGRVVAKRPSALSGKEGPHGYEKALWAKMIRQYQFQINVVVCGQVVPALEILLLEHRIREQDLIAIAARSPLVPDRREHIVGKGLFAGFEKDFITAIHLLIPQAEHMVRAQLKLRGVVTTAMDEQGIEKERGLSALLELEEAERIFGKDLHFELKALFTDPFGTNLRNEVAHGLLSQDGASSVFAVYAWWFVFRLVFLGWLRTSRSPGEQSGE